MKISLNNIFSQSVAAYLMAVQAVIGWPLTTICLLSMSQAQAAEPVTGEGAIPLVSERIGTIEYPANVQATKGRDEGLVEVSLDLPEAANDDEIAAARVFAVPLIPVGEAIDGENAALAKAIDTYTARTNKEDVSALDAFLNAYPNTRWKVALQTNLGLLRRDAGYFTEALARFEDAWAAGKNDETTGGKALADLAAGELANMNARVGRFERLAQLFAETDQRDISGRAQTLLYEAKEGYWIMMNQPAKGFRCGPHAVNAVLNAGQARYVPNPEISKEASTQQGTNLDQLQKLAGRVGMEYVAAKRGSQAAWAVPMVVHWKVGHFGAIIRKEKGKYLIKDPTFGTEVWMSAHALASEASDAGLVALKDGKLPKGWTALTAAEASEVWGKGLPTTRDDNKCPETAGCGCGGSAGMADYGILKMRGTLQISDVPVGYKPPFGPEINTVVNYTHLATGDSGDSAFANFGPFWNWNWGSYAVVDGSGTVYIVSGYGGVEKFEQSGYNATTNLFQRSMYTGAVLHRKSESRYEYEMPNGSKEIFSQAAGSTGRILLKEIVDPHGNKTILNYDGNLRLTSVVDGLSRATSITYKSNTYNASYATTGFYKVARVTDPFGRYAEFTYDSSLTRLEKIRDVIGIESAFTYGDDGFVTKLTTPYGNTQFSQYVPAEDGTARGLRVILPDGSQEVLESYMNHEMTTYYWDRKAMAMNPGDRDYAEQTHWLMSQQGQIMMDVPQWKKKALQATEYYKYPDQPDPTESPDPEEEILHYHVGALRFPTEIERSVNGVSQKYRYSYNGLGLVTKYIDPIGRQFEYLYSVNNLDLYEIRQTKGGANDLLAKFTYNSKHQPLTYTDASSGVTTYTYNARGQITTLTNPKNETTTATYDSNGYLTRIDGALSGTNDRADATYDAYDRLRTVTSNDGPMSADQYTLTYDYDALDRLTRVTYPDATTDETVYSRLDPLRSKDRLGRWTSYVYDSLRQLTETRDPAGRITNYEWCRCGSLQGLTDAMGRVTKWAYDVGHRMIKKTYPDGSHEDYEYESDLPRLKKIVDPSSNETNYTYYPDNTLDTILTSPQAGFADVPDVNLTWDQSYRRVAEASDSNMTYVYQYRPYVTNFFGSPSPGRGKLQAAINMTMEDAILGYTYDELGRLKGHTINDDEEVIWNYDSAGRLSSWSNPLGAFTPTYQNSAYGVDRLSSISFPNGQVINYQWEDKTGDFRLKQIQNLGSGSVALSKFDYVTDAASRITQWTQQRGSSTAERYDFSYDNVDQLVGAILKNTGTGSTIKSYGYTYDPAGNRTSEQIDTSVMGATSNSLNQMTGGSAGGSTRFKGTLNEPGKEVTVGGQSAQLLSQTNFVANVNLTTGTNNVAVIAKDANNNTRTNNYQVVVPSGATKTLTYDGNGNLLSDGMNTYQWDAKNRMVKITYTGGAYSEFIYDLFGRRIKIVEKNSSHTVTSTKQFVWDGLQIAEERDGSNVVKKRFFADGWRDVGGSASYFYTKDHLGSIREVTNGSSMQVAQYNYDPYGRVTKLSGSVDADMLYTGHYYHASSGLLLTPYRSYDPNLGRWISRDPIGEIGGVNLYQYCLNDPLNLFDPTGAAPTGPIGPPGLTPNPPPTNFIDPRIDVQGQQNIMDGLQGQLDQLETSIAASAAAAALLSLPFLWECYLAYPMATVAGVEGGLALFGLSTKNPPSPWSYKNLGGAIHRLWGSASDSSSGGAGPTPSPPPPR